MFLFELHDFMGMSFLFIIFLLFLLRFYSSCVWSFFSYL